MIETFFFFVVSATVDSSSLAIAPHAVQLHADPPQSWRPALRLDVGDPARKPPHTCLPTGNSPGHFQLNFKGFIDTQGDRCGEVDSAGRDVDDPGLVWVFRRRHDPLKGRGNLQLETRRNAMLGWGHAFSFIRL
jgi:hypothetical protein